MVLLGGRVLDLPDARTERLARSPLKLVVCQVRFPEVLAVSETRVGLAVQEALGGRTRWRLDSVRPPTIAFTASIGGAPAAQTAELTSGGWRLVSPDGGSTVTLMPGSLALETSRYESWDSFLGPLTALLGAADDLIKPEAEERLGLRYVNRIEDPRVATPAEWGRWIRSEVLGVVNHPGIARATTAAQQQVALDAGDGLKATLRQGFARDDDLGSFPYVLDIDTYRDEIRPFDPDDIRAAASDLNRLTLSLFQGMITEELYNYLRGGPA